MKTNSLKSGLIFFLITLNSCLAVKINKSPKTPLGEQSKPQIVQRLMIPSGKVIDLGKGGGRQKILFYGREISPSGYISNESKSEKDYQPTSRILLLVQNR